MMSSYLLTCGGEGETVVDSSSLWVRGEFDSVAPFGISVDFG